MLYHSEASINKKIELGWLVAFYGPLLTQSQQEVLRLSLEEDMSLSEIGGQLGVSRQSVHDMLSRASKQLYIFEKKLGMYQRFEKIQKGLLEIKDELQKINDGAQRQYINRAKIMLENLLQENEEA